MSIDIDKRTSSFSVTIIYLINKLPTNTAGLAIANQLVRSGTSIGANVAEAMGAHTKTEFTYKMNVVKSEAKETKYWLNLIQDTGYRIQDTGYRIQDTDMIPKSELKSVIQEIDELVAILTTIVKRSKITPKS